MTVLGGRSPATVTALVAEKARWEPSLTKRVRGKPHTQRPDAGGARRVAPTGPWDAVGDGALGHVFLWEFKSLTLCFILDGRTRDRLSWAAGAAIDDTTI